MYSDISKIQYAEINKCLRPHREKSGGAFATVNVERRKSGPRNRVCSSSVDNPSRSSRYRLEIRSSRIHKMSQNLLPVLSRIPRDLTRWVDFDGHDLADTTTLHEDDEGANAAAFSASVLAPLDVGGNERVVGSDVGARNDVCICY